MSLRWCGGAVRTQDDRGINGCRVGESILVTRMSQNLSRGSDALLTVTLSDEQALTPSMQLSKYEQVNLTARISKSGNAMQQPGDLIGSAGNVNVAGQQAVEINIDGIVN